MIQTRFKQTEALQQAEELKQIIEALPVVLAEIPLPEIAEMPFHHQVLQVKDVNVAITSNYINITPKRILVHKDTGQESDLNLFVPAWTIEKENKSSHIDENGQRMMFQMEHFDSETGEAVTVDEFGNQLPALSPEPFLMPTIPYLMFFVKQIPLPDLIATFSAQFVQDNIEYWTKLK